MSEAQVFQTGENVRVRHMNRTGRVAEGPNRKGEYLVEVGSMKIWIPSSELALLLSSNKGKAASRLNRKKQVNRRQPRELRVDLHGMRVQEALEALEGTLDKALRDGAEKIEIIHGVGTGRVRSAVEKYLKSSRHIASFRLDQRNSGTTWAYL